MRQTALAGRSLTRESLVMDLQALGVRTGDVLLVHASLRRIGWVQGGAPTVVTALREVLGETGTLVVPAQTANNSDTSRLHLAETAGMTDKDKERFRRSMPAFDVQNTPVSGMGWIAEEVRRTPGAIRSAHPQTSFAALGPQAASLMADHAPDCHLGRTSPLAQLYRTGAKLLLLGVGYGACCSFHLAEYLYTESPPMRTYRCVITENGHPRWWEYQDVELDDSDFDSLGAAFERARHVAFGRVGAAECRLADVVAAVDFATEWIPDHRRPPSHQETSPSGRPTT
jgi:aminoglycoside 3-N-acetyltransferase